MQAIHDGYNSLSFLVSLNWDRILYVATVFLALCLGAYLGSVLQY